MKFSELLTKITLAGENQTPTESKMILGAEIANKAAEHTLKELEYEKEITCRVINGNKVKKRKVRKDEEPINSEVEEAK